MTGYKQHSAYCISLQDCPPHAPFTADDSLTDRVNLGADEGLLLFVMVGLFSSSGDTPNTDEMDRVCKGGRKMKLS